MCSTRCATSVLCSIFFLNTLCLSLSPPICFFLSCGFPFFPSHLPWVKPPPSSSSTSSSPLRHSVSIISPGLPPLQKFLYVSVSTLLIHSFTSPIPLCSVALSCVNMTVETKVKMNCEVEDRLC